jgi:hypothetical protein
MKLLQKAKLALGYFPCGTWDVPDTRDYLASNVPEEQLEFPQGNVDTFNTYIKDQKRTNRCSAFALTSVVEQMLTRRLKKVITIDPAQLWGNMLKNGASETRGATLQCALKTLIEKGLVFNDYSPDGKKVDRLVTFGSYAKITGMLEAQKYIKLGHPIYTGSKVYDLGVDKDGYWDLSGEDRGGHAFGLCGYTGDFIMLNSWGEGWNDNGRALVRYKDVGKLFSMYSLFAMKIQ